MSEESAEQTPAPEAAQTEAPPWGENFDPAVAWEKIQKANREAANLRQRVISPEQQKQLEEYTQLVEASKSEQQRQSEALEAARQQGEKAQREAMRYRIALDHGLTSEDITRLGGQSEEELKGNAEWLAGLKAASNPAPAPTPQRPTENLRPGATPSGQLNEDDALYESIFGKTSN